MKTYSSREKKINEVWYQRKGLTALNDTYSEQLNTPAALAMALDVSIRELRQYKAKLDKIRDGLNGVLNDGDTA